MNLPYGISEGPRYVVSFKETLFRIACDVEVTMDVMTRQATCFIEMKSRLSTRPAFRIALEDLKRLAASAVAFRGAVGLLDTMPEHAQDHYLNASHGSATLTVVKPPGKMARYVMNVGLFSEEGQLADFDAKALDDAIARMDQRLASVLRRLDAVARN